MSLFKKDKEGPAPGTITEDVPGQLQKIVDQLKFLERKLDTLLDNQRSGNRFGANRGFSGGGGSYRGGPRQGFNPRRPAHGGHRPDGGGYQSYSGQSRGPRRHSADPNLQQKFTNH
ncbi:MAG: hypothetical protein HYT89_04195 [Candidatus Omnitrophica bacterium]|nr:hypothetical protein [Candidatus Omnitrophota bacterium]